VAVDSTSEAKREGPESRLLLALDSSSPVTSVAVGRGATILAEAMSSERHSSEHLLALIDAALGEAGLTLRDLDGLLVLRGPGSFTGLRIGLATALALHEATGIPASAVPTLDILAAASQADEAVAVVDALRGEWIAQPFERRQGIVTPRQAATRLAVEELERFAPSPLIGFGLSTIRRTLASASKLTFEEPTELATHALRWASRRPFDPDPATLTQPIYYRPPAAKRLDR